MNGHFTVVSLFGCRLVAIMHCVSCTANSEAGMNTSCFMNKEINGGAIFDSELWEWQG